MAISASCRAPLVWSCRRLLSSKRRVQKHPKPSSAAAQRRRALLDQARIARDPSARAVPVSRSADVAVAVAEKQSSKKKKQQKPRTKRTRGSDDAVEHDRWTAKMQSAVDERKSFLQYVHRTATRDSREGALELPDDIGPGLAVAVLRELQSVRRKSGKLSSSYARLFVACLRSQKIDLPTLRKVFEAFLQRGSPTTTHITSMISQLAGTYGRRDEAIALINRCAKRNIRKDRIYYNAVLSVLATPPSYSDARLSVDDVDQAWQLFEGMQDDGLRPDPITFATMIRIVGVLSEQPDHVDSAMELYDEFREVYDLPSRLQDGQNTPIETATTTTKQQQQQQQHSNKFIQQAVAVYTSVLQTMGRAGLVGDMIEVTEDMVIDGVVPNIVTINVMLKEFAAHGQFQAAQAVFDRIQKLRHAAAMVHGSKLQPVELTYIYLVQAHAAAPDQWRRAVDLTKMGMDRLAQRKALTHRLVGAAVDSLTRSPAFTGADEQLAQLNDLVALAADKYDVLPRLHNGVLKLHSLVPFVHADSPLPGGIVGLVVRHCLRALQASFAADRDSTSFKRGILLSTGHWHDSYVDVQQALIALLTTTLRPPLDVSRPTTQGAQNKSPNVGVLHVSRPSIVRFLSRSSSAI